MGIANNMEENFIKKFLSKKIDITREISALKKDVSLEIFKRYADFSESYNDKLGVIPFNDKFISYSYQRHDLKLFCDDWLNFLYNTKNKNDSSGIFFANCMAAISTLIISLKDNGCKNAVFSNLPYFESYDFAERIFGKENVKEYKNYNNEDVDILWLCTASPRFLSVDYKNIKTKNIIIDTSCIDCSHAFIKEILKHCDENNISLFLVRSHMKLDCFGLEINRLGSLVCFNDKDNILDACKNLEAYFGNNATIKNIYPWLGESDFFELTSSNILYVNSIVKKMSKLLADLLDKEKYEVCTFDNNIYFTIKLKNKVEDLDGLNRSVSFYCQSFNLPIVTAASFYLEKVGLDNFERRLDGGSQFLRISPSLYVSEKDMVDVIGRVAEYLNGK